MLSVDLSKLKKSLLGGLFLKMCGVFGAYSMSGASVLEDVYLGLARFSTGDSFLPA